MGTIDIRDLTKRATPRGPFALLANAALPRWDISLVFVGAARAKALNIKLRRKSYVPNVLSYESGTNSGEIIICLEVAKKQAASYGMSYPDFTVYLFYPRSYAFERAPSRAYNGTTRTGAPVPLPFS